MGNSRRPARIPRLPLLALLGLLLFCTGGCAMLPFALTGASFAVPPAASLAMSGAKAAHKVGFVATDERDPNTIMRDNMLALKGQSALLNGQGARDVHVYAYTGDIFAVGLVDSVEERDQIIRTLRGVRGVDEVKGLIRLRGEPKIYARMSDTALQNYVRMSVGGHLLHKNGQVEIDAVNGELCIMGVVGTHAEALDLIQYVESITGARANSLLAIRDEYAAQQPDTNRRYLLATSEEVRDPYASATMAGQSGQPGQSGQAGQSGQPGLSALPGLANVANMGGLVGPRLTLPVSPVAYPRAALTAPPTNDEHPALRTAWNKTRLRLGERITAMAKREKSELARSELLALAGHITTDRDLSITDRLSVAAAQARDPHAKHAINTLLSAY